MLFCSFLCRRNQTVPQFLSQTMNSVLLRNLKKLRKESLSVRSRTFASRLHVCFVASLLRRIHTKFFTSYVYVVVMFCRLWLHDSAFVTAYGWDIRELTCPFLNPTDKIIFSKVHLDIPVSLLQFSPSKFIDPGLHASQTEVALSLVMTAPERNGQASAETGGAPQALAVCE